MEGGRWIEGGRESEGGGGENRFQELVAPCSE